MSEPQKKIIESSSFLFINVFSSLVLGMLYTFFIARLISPIEWGYFLLAMSFITFLMFFSNFFPPAAESSILYYIPYLKSQGEEKYPQIRALIFHILKIKLLVIIVLYFVYFSILLVSNIEPILFQIFIILSPLIIIQSIGAYLSAILISFQKFKEGYLLGLITPVIYVIGFLTIFFFHLEDALILITIIHLIAAGVPLILQLIVISHLIPSKSKDIIKKKKFIGEFFKFHKNYGIYLIISSSLYQIMMFSRNLIFLNFNLVAFITYMTIITHMATRPLDFAGSDKSTHLSIFSEINYQKNPEMYENMFYYTNRYMQIILCLIIGNLFFFMDIYIIIFYSEIYIGIILAIQIYLLTSVVRLIVRNLLIIAQSTNNTKIGVKLAIYESISTLIITLFGAIYFDFLTLVIFYTINSFIALFFFIFLVKKDLIFKPKMKIILKPSFIFFISFFISLPINFLINFNFFSIHILNLLINSIIKIIIFSLIYYCLIYFTRLIIKEEFNQIVTLLPFINKEKKYIKVIIKFGEKFFPNSKKSSQFD